MSTHDSRGRQEVSERRLRLFHLDDGEDHWVAAHDADEALRLGRELYDIPAWEDEPVRIEEVPDDQSMTITFADETAESLRSDYGLPEGATIDGQRVTATVAQWLDGAEAGAMIATSVY